MQVPLRICRLRDPGHYVATAMRAVERPTEVKSERPRRHSPTPRQRCGPAQKQKQHFAEGTERLNASSAGPCMSMSMSLMLPQISTSATPARPEAPHGLPVRYRHSLTPRRHLFAEHWPRSPSELRNMLQIDAEVMLLVRFTYIYDSFASGAGCC